MVARGFSRSVRAPWRTLSVAMAGVVALLAAGTGDADARTERSAKAKRATFKAAREKPAKKEIAAKPKPPEGPLLAVISVAKQRISVYGSTGLVAQSVVSSGRAGFPTPTGVFSIIQKNRYHRSNIYSGAPMPFMQRITWSGVALHAGVVPGYPASHGCIRLTPSFAAELWGMTKMGGRVVVAPDDATAIEVVHPSLPVPTMTPAPVTIAEEGAPAKATLVTLAASDRPTEPVEVPPPPLKLANPLDRAKEAKAQTAVDAAAKAKAAKVAVEASAVQAAEANKAIAALREANLAVAAARSKSEAAAKAIEAAKSPEATERAKAGQTVADAKLQDLSKAAAEVAALEATETAEALAAARAAWDAEHASKAATAAMKAAEKGTEPISIFISKKAGRVYVRQAWAPIHEAPAVFKEPDVALGTQLYLAVEPLENGKSMRWLSVSLPPQAQRQEERRARRGDKAAEPAPQPPRPRETAVSALDRIEMPEETRKFISDKLWTGASLVISDQGISNETGKYTDFIVLTR